MTHRQIFKKVCDYLDGELDEETCEELKKHITACPRCRIYVDTVRKTIVLYQVKDSPKKMPAAARNRLYATIALKLKDKKSRSTPMDGGIVQWNSAFPKSENDEKQD